MSECYAECCPHCERHFTNLASHVCSPCGHPTVGVAVAAPPVFGFERWAEVFWTRVDRRGPNECWLWLNGHNTTGNGALSVPGPFRARVGAGKNGYALAHRVAWSLANGKALPAGAFICHRCHATPGCCNPAHLYLGNHHENANDEAVKNRTGIAFPLRNRKPRSETP